MAALPALGIVLCLLGCPSTNALVGGFRDGGAGSEGGVGGSAASVCGDGKRTGKEACEGADLNHATCADAVALGWIGSVSCTTTCTLDDKACTPPATTAYKPVDGAGSWSFFSLPTFDADATGFRG